MEKFEFTGQLKEVSTKLTVDNSRTSRVVILTQDLVAGFLESVPADQLVKVTIDVQ